MSTTGRYRQSLPDDRRKERAAASSETDKLIRDLETAISAATGSEQNSRAERSDRETERRRLDLARQRAAEERERQTREREQQDYERSRPRGRSR